MKRFRATVEYDGTGLYGFQRQRPEFRTVQGELEKALFQIRQSAITVIGAGRTDSGVHATGQVVAFDIEWDHGSHKLLKAMNANLPDDVAIKDLTETDSDFHPRFDARSRRYQYYIQNCTNGGRSPLSRHRKWQVFEQLDTHKMNEAAKQLVGTKDFNTFGTPPQGNNTIRDVLTAEWQERDGLWIFTIEANAFLYRMVRSIVGTLKLVGDGSWLVSDFLDALTSCDRSRSAAVAPAHGLYLVSVEY